MSETQVPYRVLARTYRPQSFDELIGQDALVRTLTNAIESGRIAHAFMLTGVRGVGKTTTARIIAKALNYAGVDGKAGPTTGPTEDCKICQAIAEDRHPDVIEMDAASRTGVDDIREILDGVRYAPSEARYKVYVIDEVHMLSKNAFNALLKTLEEPPEHVKFIFATTEIRKVPITVLSRCQRFDLRRVDVPTLCGHFSSICEKEGVKIEEEATQMIARAADGSVRDGLSILDQAMALNGKQITAKAVEEMLGLADRARSLDLLERALSGDMAEALEIMDDLYRAGADPVVLVQDLLDLTHVLTKLRAVPEAEGMHHAMAVDEVKRAAGLAGKLSMPTLGKTWQILLKGLGEVQAAPNPQSAAEMVLIRLAYAADLPDPAALIRTLQGQAGSAGEASAGGVSSSVSAGVPVAGRSAAPPSGSDQPPLAPASVDIPTGRSFSESPVGVRPGANSRGPNRDVRAALAIVPKAEPEVPALVDIRSLDDVVRALEEHREVLLASQVYQYVHLVKLEKGLIEIRPEPEASPKMAQDLGAALSRILETRWIVSVSGAPGAPTLAQVAQARLEAERAEVIQLPILQEILSVFPDAEIQSIETINSKGHDTP
ncbi:MAG: DNA polymerase III subunit gamma/tau [Alphaproteobacteria bacterium]|nr:DNA polymerase III subunit gamma/tau [Alphaproteobacteria bacterium]